MPTRSQQQSLAAEAYTKEAVFDDLRHVGGAYCHKLFCIAVGSGI